MADVVFVCVSEDIAHAEALAEVFENAGCTIGEGAINDQTLEICGAVIIVWSRAALRSRSFLRAAQRAMDNGVAVIASLAGTPAASIVGATPVFDLAAWDGDPEAECLDPLFCSVDYMVTTARDERAPAEIEPSANLSGWTADLPDTPLRENVVIPLEAALRDAPDEFVVPGEAKRSFA